MNCEHEGCTAGAVWRLVLRHEQVDHAELTSYACRAHLVPAKDSILIDDQIKRGFENLYEYERLDDTGWYLKTYHVDYPDMPSTCEFLVNMQVSQRSEPAQRRLRTVTHAEGGRMTVYIVVHEEITLSSIGTNDIRYHVKGVFYSIEAAQVCYPGTWRGSQENEWLMVADDHNFYRIIRIPTTIPDYRARKMGSQL